MRPTEGAAAPTATWPLTSLNLEFLMAASTAVISIELTEPVGASTVVRWQILCR